MLSCHCHRQPAIANDFSCTAAGKKSSSVLGTELKGKLLNEVQSTGKLQSQREHEETVQAHKEGCLGSTFKCLARLHLWLAFTVTKLLAATACAWVDFALLALV